MITVKHEKPVMVSKTIVSLDITHIVKFRDYPEKGFIGASNSTVARVAAQAWCKELGEPFSDVEIIEV